MTRFLTLTALAERRLVTKPENSRVLASLPSLLKKRSAALPKVLRNSTDTHHAYIKRLLIGSSLISDLPASYCADLVKELCAREMRMWGQPGLEALLHKIAELELTREQLLKIAFALPESHRPYLLSAKNASALLLVGHRLETARAQYDIHTKRMAGSFEEFIDKEWPHSATIINYIRALGMDPILGILMQELPESPQARALIAHGLSQPLNGRTIADMAALVSVLSPGSLGVLEHIIGGGTLLSLDELIELGQSLSTTI
jgi:hypothetical protein